MESTQPVTRTSPIIQKAEVFVNEIFENQVPPGYVYHNYEHTLHVRDVCLQLADAAGLNHEEREILNLAALFHDTGFAYSAEQHEEHSKEIAVKFLKGESYPLELVNRVTSCIEATKVAHDPQDRLEMIIKDADMSSLGMGDYFEQAEKLREELNQVSNEGLDESAWDLINMQFLKDHAYYTNEAKGLFEKGKKKNYKTLKKKMGLGKSGNAPSIRHTIASSKSAQTQFKTSLRNHIDLSAIADNKANIMLSVNALIITIALPILGNSLRTNPTLLIPTIILLFVCVVSIIFATLATRPIKMQGHSGMEEITQKRSNLFFFGNFYKMNFAEYEKGMQVVVADNELLDNTIIRDLFFLGKALGKKYHYLRLCYNVFMFGIIGTVIAFTTVFIMTTSGG